MIVFLHVIRFFFFNSGSLSFNRSTRQHRGLAVTRRGQSISGKEQETQENGGLKTTKLRVAQIQFAIQTRSVAGQKVN